MDGIPEKCRQSWILEGFKRHFQEKKIWINSRRNLWSNTHLVVTYRNNCRSPEEIILRMFLQFSETNSWRNAKEYFRKSWKNFWRYPCKNNVCRKIFLQESQQLFLEEFLKNISRNFWRIPWRSSLEELSQKSLDGNLWRDSDLNLWCSSNR